MTAISIRWRRGRGRRKSGETSCGAHAGADRDRISTAPDGPRGLTPGARGGLAALADLQPVAVGVLELRDVAPGELEHVRDELDPARLQLLDRLAAVVGLDRDRCRG